jgi:tetratricopeptide (TPR) repeat protein
MPSRMGAESLAFCERALEYGKAANDLRLKVAGWSRIGAAHVHRGDAAGALQCCAEALALSPAPFDSAFVSAVHGYALVKAGHVDAGTAELEQTVAWFERARLQYTRLLCMLRLSEGYLRQGKRERARGRLDDVLATARALGYRHLEGVADQLLGECLTDDDPADAASCLERAAQIFHDIGARNDFAKTLVEQAQLARGSGDHVRKRELLERALDIFQTLGTLDEPARVLALLRTQ